MKTTLIYVIYRVRQGTRLSNFETSTTSFVCGVNRSNVNAVTKWLSQTQGYCTDEFQLILVICRVLL